MKIIDFVNWSETQKEFGYTEKKFKPKDQVIINCSECNCNIIVKYNCIRLTKNGMPYIPICKSCQQKRTWEDNQEFREKVSKSNSESMKKIWENQEYQENQSKKHIESSKKTWKNEEYKNKVSESIKNKHKNDPDYTNKTSKFTRSEETKEKIKRAVKKWYENEDHKKVISKASKKLWSEKRNKLLELFRSEEYREKQKRIHTTPEALERSKANGIKFWNENKEKLLEIFKSEEYRNKLKEIWEREGYREKQREKSKKLWKDPEYVKKCIGNHSSKLEDHLAELLANLEINFTRQFQIGPYLFDFMVQMDDRKSILIEVQGEYWHFKRFGNKESPRDKAKATYIEKYYSNDFVLKTIWENEFLSPIRLRNRLNEVFDNPIKINDFNFKDCKIVLIDNQESSLFFSKYHYSASGGRGGLNIGCFINDKLIACCRYCSPTRNESAHRLGIKSNELLELTKFCIHPNYQKKNVASWFLSRTYSFIPSNIKFLISFADETFGHNGTIYKASNWTYDGEVDPSYVYINKEGFVIHKKTLWNHASKMSMKESDYADLWGFTKMWGSKKHRFLKRLD